MRGGTKAWATTLVWLLLLYLAVFHFDRVEGPLTSLFGSGRVLRSRATLPYYALEHLTLVAVSTALSMALGLGLGLLVRVPALREFRDPLIKGATFLETIPSTVVLALSVPVLGYGQKPAVLALVFYGLLPILRNTVEGLDAVPAEALLAASGLGMTGAQRLVRVEWPLALPAIFAGIRTSVIINISAATIGAVVGTGGLGVLIVNGFRSMDTTMILKGALPVSLMALLVDSLFTVMEERWFHQRRVQACA